MEKIKLLFVCTGGYRAKIASEHLENNEKYDCKSLGIYSISEKEMKENLDWADKVICITKEHYEFIKKYFKTKDEKLVCLDLSNDANEEEIKEVCKLKLYSLK